MERRKGSKQAIKGEYTCRKQYLQHYPLITRVASEKYCPSKKKDTVNKIKHKDTVNKIKHRAKRKKAFVKQVSSVMDAKFCQALLHRPHHSLIK